MRLSDFKVLSFDCYGTLVDWETGIERASAPLLEGARRSREEALASFARHESALEAERPGLRYSDLLADVHRRIAAEWEITASQDDHRAFARSIAEWPLFSDSRDALRYLTRFHSLVILSNVDRAGFAETQKRLGIDFAAIYTAEEIGSYKPDARNFRYLIDALGERGYAKGDILHVAQSLYHDHAPANRAGLASAWIDRRSGSAGWGATPPPAEEVHYDFRFASLAELVLAHRAEARR